VTTGRRPVVQGWLGAFFAVVLVLGADAAFRVEAWVIAAVLSLAAAACAAAMTHALVAARAGAGAENRGWERVSREVERARRTNGSLVVARFPLALASPRPAWGLAEQAERSLRGSDAIWVEGRSVILLLAGARRDDATSGIERVSTRFDGLLAAAPLVAAFPEDTLTFGGLVDALHPGRRRQSRHATVIDLRGHDENRSPVGLEAQSQAPA
jgi:hypothetical protein